MAYLNNLNLLVILFYSIAVVTKGLEIFNPTAPSSPRNSLTCLDHVKEEHQISIENFASVIQNNQIPSNDYNEWIRIVVSESMQLCLEGDEICEGGIFSGVVQGMRSAVSMRDGKDFEELMKEYLSEETSEESKKLLLDVTNVVRSMNPNEGSTEDQLEEINIMLANFNDLSALGQKVQKSVELGLAGAKQWKHVFQNTSHALNDVSTSQCKEKRQMRTEGIETLIVQKVFSELIMSNFLGGAYAVFDVEQSPNSPEKKTLNTETAAMISFVSASLPVITTALD